MNPVLLLSQNSPVINMVTRVPASQRGTDHPLLVCWCLCALSLQLLVTPPEGEEKPPAGLQPHKPLRDRDGVQTRLL